MDVDRAKVDGPAWWGKRSRLYSSWRELLGPKTTLTEPGRHLDSGPIHHRQTH